MISIHTIGADNGCLQCRSPAYKGKRGPDCKPKHKGKAKDKAVKKAAVKTAGGKGKKK